MGSLKVWNGTAWETASAQGPAGTSGTGGSTLLAYADGTAAQSWVAGGNVLLATTAPVVVPAGRRIELSGGCTGILKADATGPVNILVADTTSAYTISGVFTFDLSAGGYGQLSASRVFTSVAGTFTFRTRLSSTVGGGSVPSGYVYWTKLMDLGPA